VDYARVQYTVKLYTIMQHMTYVIIGSIWSVYRVQLYALR